MFTFLGFVCGSVVMSTAEFIFGASCLTGLGMYAVSQGCDVDVTSGSTSVSAKIGTSDE